jgi:hypothetical protein
MVVIAMSFSSCATYQYATVSSDMEMNDSHEFLVENDTLIIKYSFKGPNCPVRIQVQNKLDRPLYIDWKRSAIVLNNTSHTYWRNIQKIDATATGYQVGVSQSPAPGTVYNRSSWTTTDISGALTGEEALSFVAPRSMKESHMLSIDSKIFKMEGKPVDIQKEMNGTRTKVRVYKFEKDESPLQYRSYLTLSTDADFKTEFTSQNEFWVSEVVNSGSSPREFLKDNDKDIYFKTELTSAGTAFAVIGIFGVGILASIP